MKIIVCCKTWEHTLFFTVSCYLFSFCQLNSTIACMYWLHIYVLLCNRWHVNKNYKTKSTTKQTGYCGSDAVTLYKKCSWRWMGGRVSRSISPQWNHKAAMHGPWEAPRCSAGIAINQPTTPSKDIKTTTSHHYHHQTTFKKWAWQHTSQSQQHPNT